MPQREQARLDGFVAGTSFVMRILIFVLLGAQLDFGLVGSHLAGGIGVVAIFMLVARPATVFLCAVPDRRARWTLPEMLLMCWTRETGVIPGALAGLLVGMNAPEARVIASVTFIAILVTILVQATTTRWLAHRLGLN
jgi:cell volume regulation protein A